MKLGQKGVIVTGAGSGIGQALVLELLRRQARVAAIDLRPDGLAQTAAKASAAPGRLGTFTLDVSRRDAVENAAAAVSAHLGGVDGLINCAGIIQPFVRLMDLDYAAIERVFNVNWWGTVYMTKTFLPQLLSRPEAHLVNVSSMGGFLPVPGQTVYGASKAAVKLFTEGLHSELADTPVRVTAVFPGAVATHIVANSGVTVSVGSGKGAPITSAETAAQEILDGMERDAFRVLVGRDAKGLDALYRLSPRRATAFIARKMKELLNPGASEAASAMPG